ncbi:serine/threonine protein kinase [Bacillus xiapuensis]|uniref:serine/threonine protein kinase n=1 Tax=Bacillus xiapuensis TaxID=2014075 RepID=UPI001E5CD98D|nr:protein kinase [Bacillus xiapuensis]
MRAIRKIYQFFTDTPLKKGTLLHDRYQIEKVIGTGSYGIAYLCSDLKTKENKVVKQLRPSKRRSREEKMLFKNEAAILHSLQHQSLPALYEMFSFQGQLFYVMSFIGGANLEDELFLHKQQFNELESLLVMKDLLQLVDYLHQKGIYHQDLRTPNILVKNRQLFVIDFGLAKRVHDVCSPDSTKEVLQWKQQDYYDIGELLLYLLYTTYSSQNKKALPWTEELSLAKETDYLLRRLLKMNRPYTDTREISADLALAIQAQEK